MSEPDGASKAVWRIGWGWPDATLQAELASLGARATTAPRVPFDATDDPGWTVEQMTGLIAQEPPGPPLPDGPFMRARAAIAEYRFADPRITRGIFDPASPLLGRNLLVEARILAMRMLMGLRINEVTDTADDAHTELGIRLDTLEGHVLDGCERVLIRKDHRDGTVRLLLHIQWRPTRTLPWWMGIGQRLLGRQTQRRWRRQALRRLRILAGAHPEHA